MNKRNKNNKANRTATFQQILEGLNEEIAETAWQRAWVASRMRHAAVRQGRNKTARILASVKADALRTAATLNPEEIRVGIDGEYQIGLLSVCWVGHGQLHLPANTEMNSVA